MTSIFQRFEIFISNCSFKALRLRSDFLQGLRYSSRNVPFKDLRLRSQNVTWLLSHQTFQYHMLGIGFDNLSPETHQRGSAEMLFQPDAPFVKANLSLKLPMRTAQFQSQIVFHKEFSKKHQNNVEILIVRFDRSTLK